MLVPLTGLLTGLAAVALVRTLAVIQKLFWGSGRELIAQAETLSSWHRFLAPLIGGVLIGIFTILIRGAVKGHGTVSLIEAVTQHRGYVPVRATLVKAAATLITVGSGGSLGRESPLMRVGAALGSVLGRRFHLTGNRLNILVGCGTAAGIAAAYNAPIGGALFALEVVLGSFALESFGPIVVASALGTIVSRSLLGHFQAYNIPPMVTLVSGWDVVHYLALGLVVGCASAVFLFTLRGAERGFHRAPLPRWLKPILGFGVVGILGIRFPEVFGNGYEVVNEVVRDNVPLQLILILPFLKVIATSVTRGSGGSGGLFTPTLFVGSVLGSAYGSWCHHVFPHATSTPATYALIAMGAMIAGTTQAPLTAILMIFELTGDYQIILPLMICCTVALVTGRLLHPESLYTEPLVERGVRLGGRMEQLVMDKIEVRDVMREGVKPVDEEEILEVVVKRLLDEGRKELFVVNSEGRFQGTITLADITQYLDQPESLKKVKAREVLYAGLPVLHLGERLSEAIGRWSQVSRDRLPVVDTPSTQRYVGELSAGDIIFLYSQEVLHKETRLARFERATGGDRPETTYVELPGEYVVALVTLPESFEGTTLRELDARRRFGVNVIEVKRSLTPERERRIIPGPDTELKGGDGLIVVGRPTDIAHLNDPARLSDISRHLATPEEEQE